MRGYGHGELTQSERTRRRLYCRYLTLVMTIETVYRGHADARQYDFAREQLAASMALFGHGPGRRVTVPGGAVS
jgi:hypothetical protein